MIKAKRKPLGQINYEAFLRSYAARFNEEGFEYVRWEDLDPEERADYSAGAAAVQKRDRDRQKRDANKGGS